MTAHTKLNLETAPCQEEADYHFQVFYILTINPHQTVKQQINKLNPGMREEEPRKKVKSEDEVQGEEDPEEHVDGGDADDELSAKGKIDHDIVNGLKIKVMADHDDQDNHNQEDGTFIGLK